MALREMKESDVMTNAMGNEINKKLCKSGVGLNFVRPDTNRPGNYSFIHDGTWLVSQYRELGVRWNRVAFSWVMIEGEKGHYDWTPYDRVVEACEVAGIEILATLGGHFDAPPVPSWAGACLKEVVDVHPDYLEEFIRQWGLHYKGRIRYWEILNEPKTHHAGLSVLDYVEKILKPGYVILKALDPQATVLPCAFNNLPIIGDPDDFWDNARGYYDIHNYHLYTDWGFFRRSVDPTRDVQEVMDFQAKAQRFGEGDKPLWITEFGWWGTGGITGSIYDTYRFDPNFNGMRDWRPGILQPSYTGKEILAHPTVLREDAFRAKWLAQVFPRLLSLPGCEKAFLWASMDEFEGGYHPDAVYGKKSEDGAALQVDLWGIIAGDRSWRKSAFALQKMLFRNGPDTVRP